MCLCCILSSLLWLSLCKIFFVYFLSCPIVINYIKTKTKTKNIASFFSKMVSYCLYIMISYFLFVFAFTLSKIKTRFYKKGYIDQALICIGNMYM